MKKYPLVTIVVLNWNGLADTVRCVESLLGVTYVPLRIIVVDNSSDGPDADVVQSRFAGKIELIRNPANIGYAAGNNVGIRRALEVGSDYVLILNNDTLVTPGFLGPLVDEMENNPRIGIIGPRQMFLEEPEKTYYAGGYVNLWLGNYGHYGIGRKEHEIVEPKDTSFVGGSAMLLSRELIEKVGLIPEDYFLLFEDIDYCLRARREGFSCYYHPESTIYHKYSGSISRGEKKISNIRIYYSTRNRILFLRRNANAVQFATSIAYFIFFEGPKRLAYWTYCNRDLATGKLFIRALIDGFRERTGRQAI